MRIQYAPAVVALGAALGGFAVIHAALPSVAMAQDSSPAPASPSPASLPSASPLNVSIVAVRSQKTTDRIDRAKQAADGRQALLRLQDQMRQLGATH